jgi:hypothetical protein
MEKAEMKELHQLMADALYRDGRSFTLFHTPAMQRFLKNLNPAFVLPSVTSLREEHLENAY